MINLLIDGGRCRPCAGNHRGARRGSRDRIIRFETEFPRPETCISGCLAERGAGTPAPRRLAGLRCTFPVTCRPAHTVSIERSGIALVANLVSHLRDFMACRDSEHPETRR